MLNLLTLAEAQQHLRLTATDLADADLAASVTLYMEAATATVLDYVKAEPGKWTPTTLPYTIKAAILLTLAELFQNREDGDIPEGARRLLRMHRTPTVA